MLAFLDADDRQGFIERHRQIYRDYRARLETLLFEDPQGA
jgi:virulence-associated protein VapD